MSPFTPTDLRIVDPRPTRPPESEEATVRELLTSRLSGAELSDALQALGLEPYERQIVPERAFPAGDMCRNGHDRREFSRIDRKGWSFCRKCRSERASRKVVAA